jgi:hypothetical protein
MQDVKQRMCVMKFKYYLIKIFQCKIKHWNNNYCNDIHKYSQWIKQAVMLQVDREFVNVHYEKCHVSTQSVLGFTAVLVLPHLNEHPLPDHKRIGFVFS